MHTQIVGTEIWLSESVAACAAFHSSQESIPPPPSRELSSSSCVRNVTRSTLAHVHTLIRMYTTTTSDSVHTRSEGRNSYEWSLGVETNITHGCSYTHTNKHPTTSRNTWHEKQSIGKFHSCDRSKGVMHCQEKVGVSLKHINILINNVHEHFWAVSRLRSAIQAISGMFKGQSTSLLCIKFDNLLLNGANSTMFHRCARWCTDCA